MISKCAYCEVNVSGNSEHVFPKSLGGQNIYMDCVCNQCNNNFSKSERELFQKSLVGLMRSIEGLEGYSKNKLRPAPLKFSEIFQLDIENQIVYEVGVHSAFKHYLRPQLIQVKDKIYAESGSYPEMENFVKIFNEWRKEDLVLITEFPSRKGEKYKCIQFVLHEDEFLIKKIELIKVKKEAIYYSLLKNNKKIAKHFMPRIFLDDSGKLIVRSRKVEEGIQFIIKLLTSIHKGEGQFKNFTDKNLNDPVHISMSFDVKMMQQALVKIGLNALMHYYPETKYNQLLRPAKNYALGGESIRAGLDIKVPILDNRQDIHSILFYQLNEGIMIRSALFGGSFTYKFLIENLFIFNLVGNVSGLIVDFKNSSQNHYIMDDFLFNLIRDTKIKE